MQQLDFLEILEQSLLVCPACKKNFEKSKHNFHRKYCSEACFEKIKKEKKALSDKKYREKNRDVLIKKKKNYYQKNKTILLEKQKIYREQNKEHKAKRDKEYVLKNREKVLKRKKDYYQRNKTIFQEKGKIYRKEKADEIKEYRLKNKDRIAEVRRMWAKKNIKHVLKYRKNRRETDIQYRIKQYLRSRINSAISHQKTTKHSSSLKLLGCSIQEAKEHIEKQFKKGMTWENYGHKTWHIDHIIPCASFDLTDPEQQKKCFHYTNLQPLWAYENFSKGAKILS
jgi:endogenous inhibitor of DNA gyrase (YacG/DUF329 family)